MNRMNGIAEEGSGWRILAAVAVVCMACWGCRRQDYRTVTIDVPAMKNKACAERVVKAMMWELARCQAFEKDKRIGVDLERRKVTVTYDSLKLSLKNIERAIAVAGFSADDVPASAEAAANLPAECR